MVNLFICYYKNGLSVETGAVTPVWSQTISNLCKENHENTEDLL